MTFKNPQKTQTTLILTDTKKTVTEEIFFFADSLSPHNVRLSILFICFYGMAVVHPNKYKAST